VFVDWDAHVRGCVARLRALAGTEPDAPDLAQLVDELMRESPEFATMWERYEVKGNTFGSKTFRHPEVGVLTLGYQGMALEGSPGHRLVTYYAEPGTTDHDAMVLLDLTVAEQLRRSATPDTAEQPR
jgi:hypothetical protein